MKRYARTKDGRIVEEYNLKPGHKQTIITIKNKKDNKELKKLICDDLDEHLEVVIAAECCACNKINPRDVKCETTTLFFNEVLKRADTIEELIEVGDLTTYGFVRKLGKGDKIFYNGFEWIYLDLIIELYTKKGDNYILVATKENGEWRVL